MFAGHFGLAAAVKAKSPETPIWALMLSTQLLDVVFVPLFVAGIETMEPVGDGYGESIIHADYTHSLLAALLIAVAAGFLAKRFWGRRSGIVIGMVVFSHWLLDLLVHRADMPILPGNLGGMPLLGFGIWRWPAASMAIEVTLILIGLALYVRSMIKKSKKSGSRLPYAASVAMFLLLALAVATDMMGI